MSDTVQEIKDKLDIVTFLRSYLAVSPAGKNFKALCPFHKEKTPSFIVSPERQVWHCFGCNLGGDLISFVMRYENLEFVEALKVLADKAGIDLKQFGTSDQKKFSLLYEINAAAKDFFKRNLATVGHSSAYLKERGLKTETVEEFELGFAPHAYDALLQHLTKADYHVADIERAGLIFKTDRGTYMDRFRNRITFPLYNSFGKVIGFTGRILPGETAEVGKYVNSPETPIFQKSKLLFGLHKSKNAIRDLRCAVLVEGQMDFLMAWQDGVKNAVATSGTALTSDHLQLLKRIADTLILAFDQDNAGQTATERTIDMADAMDFSVKVMSPPDTDSLLKDPADMVKGQSGLLQQLIGKAEPSMEYYFRKFLNTAPLIVKKSIRTLLSKIKVMASPIERSVWIKELSLRTGIDERALSEEMENLHIDIEHRTANGEQSTESQPQFQTPLSRKDIISQRLLSLVLSKKEYCPMIQAIAPYLAEDCRIVFDHLQAKTSALPSHAQNLVDLLWLRSGIEAPNDDQELQKELQELTQQLRAEHLKEQRQQIQEKIRHAEQLGDEATLVVALAEFDKISKEMYKLAP